MFEKVKSISFPVTLTFFYLIFTYFYIEYVWKNGLLMSVTGTTSINMGVKLLCDFISSLLIVLVILSITYIKKRPLNVLGISFKSPILITALLAIYCAMFLLNGDFTAKGFYAAFFYLIIVSFSEEFVFRGYLFAVIDREFGFWVAAIISGLLFGAAHAFMPSIINDYNTPDFISTILSNLLGQGILGGALFAILYKKSKTLFVPVLIHAILDYSSVLFA